MSADLIYFMLAAFGFGLLAAYIDIDSFFRSKRISYTTASNALCYLFLAINGALAAGLVYWAITTDKDSIINTILHVQSSLAKTVIIAFGVPLLLKSKLFSFGEEQTPAGPAIAYDWARLKVLYDINEKSATFKERLATENAQRYAAQPAATKAGFPARIKLLVDNYVRPFATAADTAQLQREYDAINAAHTVAGSPPLSEDHFRELIRWSMDSTKIGYVRSQLV